MNWVFPTCIASISPSIAALRVRGENCERGSTYVKAFGQHIGPSHPGCLTNILYERVSSCIIFTQIGFGYETLTFGFSWDRLPRPWYIAQMVTPWWHLSPAYVAERSLYTCVFVHLLAVRSPIMEFRPWCSVTWTFGTDSNISQPKWFYGIWNDSFFFVGLFFPCKPCLLFMRF